MHKLSHHLELQDLRLQRLYTAEEISKNNPRSSKLRKLSGVDLGPKNMLDEKAPLFENGRRFVNDLRVQTRTEYDFRMLKYF